MTFLDFFIVNVALPSVQSDLHAGPAMIQFVVAGYGIAFAVGMISGGRLGDLYGRRRMFTLGLVLFTLTSAGCGLAPSAGLLVTARVLQGVAGALMTPQVLAILGTVVHRREAGPSLRGVRADDGLRRRARAVDRRRADSGRRGRLRLARASS